MRVIAGSAGGRQLKGPPRTGVRPTTDRVREAIFEVLDSHGYEMDRVLDLYSGTGALGIEALSRGAELCRLRRGGQQGERGRAREPGAHPARDRGKVYPMTVARALSRLSGPYDLVVADPPYEYDRAERELSEVIEQGLLADGGTLVVEHSKRRDWPDELAGRPRVFNRRYGDTASPSITERKTR